MASSLHHTVAGLALRDAPRPRSVRAQPPGLFMKESSFHHPRFFLNRELSWLEFNARVLEEAQDRSNPLLERLKFLTIFGGNLDEFFMIRVANLKELVLNGVVDTPPDGMTPSEQLAALSDRCHELTEIRNRLLVDDLLPALANRGIVLRRVAELDGDQAEWVEAHFFDEVFPVLTPLTVDPSHPFPHLNNLSLHLVVVFEPSSNGESSYAIVDIPQVLSPLVQLPTRGETVEYILLSDIVRHYAEELFLGLKIKGRWLARVTRNSDLALEETEIENLMKDLERELRNRVFRRAVRLEVERAMPEDLRAILLRGLELEPRKVYEVDAVMNLGALNAIWRLERFRHLKDPPFNPRLSGTLNTNGSIFSVLRERDILLHHPYESFSTVVELLQHAAQDPKVLAMKLTLYRTSGDSVIIQALKDAAENGKQVTAVVELKARFDERNNIVWARELERAGVHVVYGIVGLKTHCKAALIVRRESGMIRRYVHLSTGNYNSATARLYTDIALLSSNLELGEDVSRLFNILTGYAARHIRDIISGSRPEPEFNLLHIAPFSLRDYFVELIEDEIRLHTPETPGLIQAKVNSLVDPDIIDALYRASAAGVTVRLNVRGICCLRPGLPGISDTITVVSIIDRFLEHPRIFHFRHGGEDLVYAGSADWMPRNLDRRIEVLFPIEAPELKARVIEEIFGICFQDNVKARRLQHDGRWVRVQPSEEEPRVRAQSRFIELAREAGLKSVPYDDAVREARRNRRRRLPTLSTPAIRRR